MARPSFTASKFHLFSIIACTLISVITGCDGQEEEPDDPGPQIMLLRPLPDVTFQVWRDTTINLQDHFAHSDNGPLSFAVNVDTPSETPDAVSARVMGLRLIITPYDAGITEVIVTASDSIGTQRSDTLNAEVLVTAHPLTGDYTLVSALDYYGEWTLPALREATSGCVTFWYTGGTLGISRNGDVVQVSLWKGICGGPPPLNSGIPVEREGRFTSANSGWLEMERDTFDVRMVGDTLELSMLSGQGGNRFRYIRSQ